MSRTRVSERLPDFPWDQLAAYAETARAHPDGVVDLSIGTPVDPTPAVVQDALRAAADSPGYPTTQGLPETRQAAVDWLARRHGVTGLGIDGVLPVIGSKELIASLPGHLGLGPGDVVGYPELAYPTYEVGAALCGARGFATDSLTAFGPERPALLWLNSPSNPTGRVLPVEHLRKVVEWCREGGTLLVSDECYLECVWDPETPAVSVLHPDVCGGSYDGVLSVHSLSKRSNLAGYRCGFVAGDPAVLAELLAVRKNLGLMQPGPQQRAMVAALADDDHVAAQHATYAAPADGAPRRGRGRRVPGRPLRGVALPVGHPRRGLLGHRRLVRRAGRAGRAGLVLRRRGVTSRTDRVHRDGRTDPSGAGTPGVSAAPGRPGGRAGRGGGPCRGDAERGALSGRRAAAPWWPRGSRREGRPRRSRRHRRSTKPAPSPARRPARTGGGR